MPFMVESRSSSSSARGSDTDYEHVRRIFEFQHVVEDSEYATASIPGCSDKPLSEQLEPIAVCGMACRLPGDVNSASEFWDMMMQSRSGNTQKVPSTRFNIDAHLHPNNDRPGSFNVPGGYFLKDTLKEFDPSFFNMTPIEGMWLDPQQRKLLELTYEAFESAGVTLEEVAGTTTGVYVASFTSDFQQMTFKESAFRHSFAATGTDPGILSNRISHVFNLMGPSQYINTACSSSVYAINNACNALRNKECVAAVVGGSNLIMTVDQHMNTAKLGVLSPTSTCHTFDASADGYGRAEAVGAVYLKRLSDAITNGDPVRGVIRASATNNNGKVPNLGITHPNRDGQVQVIKHAYERGGLDPRLTGYFEIHGTGTPVGDPIEVNAVANAMTYNRSEEEGPLLIGAVKTNVGHSEAASGLSALIKGILAVERGVIPPTKGVTNPNPAIKWKDWKVTVNNAPVPFPALPVRRIGINSFGYGGTNAHMIVEAADSLLASKQSYKYYEPSKGAAKAPRGTAERKRPFLIPFAAHEKAAVQRNVLAHIDVAHQYSLHDLAYTLSNRRTAMNSRGFAVVSHATRDELSEKKLGMFSFSDMKKPPTIGFVFTGQGAQWPRMGADLMSYYPSFLRTIRVLDTILGDLDDAPEWTIEDSLMEDADISCVHEAEFSQPLCTAVQIALVNLLSSWGITPAVTVGHSSGEIAAAYAAGYISASDAIIKAFYRGKVVKDINTNGGMCAVGLGAEDVQPYLSRSNGRVVVACHNSPSGVTLSGDLLALQEVQKDLSSEGIFCRMVKTNGKAYHSPHMAPAAAKYEAMLERARLTMLPFDVPWPSEAKMVSSVTNSVLSKGTVLDHSYFSANLKSPVLFNQAVQTILTSQEFADVDLFIEVGPHSAMSGPIRQIKTTLGVSKLDYVPTLLRGENCSTQMLKVAGELFNRGYPINLERISAVERAEQSGKIVMQQGNLIVDLPRYQWGQKIYFAENRQSAEHRNPAFPRHDLLGALLPGNSLSEPTWRNVLRIRDVPWLVDHSLGGEAIFPAAGYFASVIEAITQMNETSKDPKVITGYTLRDVTIKQALVSPDNDDGIEVMLNMRLSTFNDSTAENPWWDFNVSSVDMEGTRRDHMIGSIALDTSASRPSVRQSPNLPQLASGKEWNQALRSVGFDYGPTFADLDNIRFDGKNYFCTGTTKLRTDVGVVQGGESRTVIHPVTVDTCLQLLITAIYAGRTKAMKAGAVPIQVDQVSIWKPSTAQLENPSASALAWIDERGLRNFNGGCQLLGSDGQVVMAIENMRCTLYEAAVPQTSSEPVAPKPFGKLVWKQDLDSLAPQTSLTIPELVELAAHKTPSLTVLDIGGVHYKALLEQNPTLAYSACTEDAEADEYLKQELALYKNAATESIDIINAPADGGKRARTFDVIIVPESNVDVNIVRQAANPGGKILVPGKISNTVIQVPDLSQEVRTRTSNEILLVYRETAPELLSLLMDTLGKMLYKTVSSRLADCDAVKAENVVILDLDQTILASCSKHEFETIQGLIEKSNRLTWVTAGGLLTAKDPKAGMVAGLARAIRAEQATKKIVTIDVDFDNCDSNEIVKFIAAKTDALAQDTKLDEMEYYISRNQVHISRLVTNDEVVARHIVDNSQLETVTLEADMRLSGRVQSGHVVFEQEDANAKSLGPDDVEIKVAFAGLSREGVAIISGSDYPTNFSHEIAGTIERVGSSVKSLSVGQKVVGFSFERFSTFQIARADHVRKLLPHESLEKVVTLPMAYGAALYGIKDLANVKPSDIVVILEGAGHAGTAAIELSLLTGVVPYVSVSTEVQAAAITSKFGVPPDHVLVSQQTVIDFLHTTPADVIFSSGSTPDALAREAWRSIGHFGRFIDSGRKNALRRNTVNTVPFQRGATYFSFDMLDLYEHKPRLISELLARTLSLYRDGKIATILRASVKNISELDQAVAAFRDDYQIERAVIGYSSGSSVKLAPRNPTLKLSADATYLLVGCLGGLGRSLSSWMLAKGARNFCFLSRSGADAKEASLLVEDLKKVGANIQICRGDASKLADVERAVKSIPASRPVRGVVNAAMVLRDNLFHKMTYADWTTSISPKVYGSENLHKALSNTPLDFFLMTSSVSGLLGTPGQANYAAANCFMDSLARQRQVAGQKACAAIVPMVLGIGVVAENRAIEDSLTRKGMYGIDEEHLLQAFETAVIEQAHAEAPIDHLVIGLDPSLLQKAINAAGEDCDPFWTADSRFRAVLHDMASSSNTSSGEGGQSTVGLLKAAGGFTEASIIAKEAVEHKIARMLMLSADDFEDAEKSIADYGIDSMIGAEFRNWVFKDFGIDVPFQQLLGSTMTPTKLGGILCQHHGINE